MMSGWFSGHPVAKAVTKSADVDRSFISRISSTRWHESGDFDLDLATRVDKAGNVEQRRGREIPSQRLLPGRADPGARGFIFAAAGQIPGQSGDMLRPGS